MSKVLAFEELLQMIFIGCDERVLIRVQTLESRFLYACFLMTQ